MHNWDENKLKKINLIKKSEDGMGNRKNNFYWISLVVLTKNKRLFRFDSCLTLQNSFFFSFDIAFLLYRFRFFSLYFVFLLYRFRRFFSLDFVFLLYRFRFIWLDFVFLLKDFASFRWNSFSYFTDFVGFCFRFVSFRFFLFLSLSVPLIV